MSKINLLDTYCKSEDISNLLLSFMSNQSKVKLYECNMIKYLSPAYTSDNYMFDKKLTSDCCDCDCDNIRLQFNICVMCLSHKDKLNKMEYINEDEIYSVFKNIEIDRTLKFFNLDHKNVPQKKITIVNKNIILYKRIDIYKFFVNTFGSSYKLLKYIDSIYKRRENKKRENELKEQMKIDFVKSCTNQFQNYLRHCQISVIYKRSLNEIKSIYERYETLKTLLSSHQIKLRTDSKLCMAYIIDNEFIADCNSIIDIYEIMDEMKFLYTQTFYKDMLNELLDSAEYFYIYRDIEEAIFTAKQTIYNMYKNDRLLITNIFPVKWTRLLESNLEYE